MTAENVTVPGPPRTRNEARLRTCYGLFMARCVQTRAGALYRVQALCGSGAFGVRAVFPSSPNSPNSSQFRPIPFEAVGARFDPGTGADVATVSSQWLYRLPQPRPHLWHYFFRHRYQLAPRLVPPPHFPTLWLAGRGERDAEPVPEGRRVALCGSGSSPGGVCDFYVHVSQHRTCSLRLTHESGVSQWSRGEVTVSTAVFVSRWRLPDRVRVFRLGSGWRDRPPVPYVSMITTEW